MPAVAAPAAPAPAAASGKRYADTITDATPKEQIRRVALVYTDKTGEACDLFVSFLDQSALTISKKPLFLRKVAVAVYVVADDANAVAKTIKGAGAVAVLALLDGLAEVKVKELDEACLAEGLSFRLIENAEVQKRSVAVDIMVDFMLLAGDA